MNPRIAVAAVAVIMLLLGLFGLFRPAGAMDLVGFAPERAAEPAGAYGEARATYGGLFVAAGAFLLWASTNPAANRGVILFVSLLWLGAAGGRFLGVIVDGNPGLFGWFSIVFEVAVGAVLLIASQMPDMARTDTPPPFGT